ncbi:MAG: MFS transporter [Acidimicrobiia bacterium]|nr:MFS transporter [Acidimicrobiia bacterium]
MPHVRRRMLITVGAPPASAKAAATRLLGAEPRPDGSSVAPLVGATDAEARLRVEVRPAAGGACTVALEGHSGLRVPFFGWFFRPLLALQLGRLVRHAGRLLAADVEGRPPPPPPRAVVFLPAVRFSERQVQLLATASAFGALAAFGSALFGQNADSVADSFGASNAALGTALAVTRAGVLVALVATAAADRRGRRLLVTASFAGLCVANGLAALAPTLATFTAAQLVVRAFVNATVVVAGIAVVEDAPEGARAYAATMFALASGAGFSLAVVLLPLADLGPETWRIAFGVSGLGIVLLPRLWRTLPETRRYEHLATRTTISRGRFSGVVDRSYGPRFAVLAAVAFLGNVFSAPSAQLTNRFLADERGFSNLGIAVLRGVTNGLPGLFGLVLGGRLAESRGRRPVAATGLALATVLQVTFFLTHGVVLWSASTFAIVAAGAAAVSLGTLDAELFPTEVRSTSNALLLVFGVAGSMTGLAVSGVLSDPLGGLGPAIALCGAAPFVAALLLVPRLPEPAHRHLDEVSPSRE